MDSETAKSADYLSRLGDADDWQINQSVFSQLNQTWGPHHVDRFASSHNKKCVRYNSRWWFSGTEAVNAFNQNWAAGLNWVVPPPRLATQVISKLEKERANCTLILPMWKSAPFWPMIANAQGFKNFVDTHVVLDKLHCVLPGQGNNGVFGKAPLPFHMVALKIRFS